MDGFIANRVVSRIAPLVTTVSYLADFFLSIHPYRNRWPLLYLTVRDQILSPIVQGAVFGVGGIALSQLKTFLAVRRRNGRTSGARTGH